MNDPDEFCHYWHDTRREERIFCKRQGGEQYFMIWAAFSQKGETDFSIINKRQSAGKYTEILELFLIPFIDCSHSSSWIFQQDNVSIHTAHHKNACFQKKNIEVMERSTKNPVLSSTRKPWGILARRVHANRKHFSILQKLRAKVVLEWSQVGKALLSMLIHSMQKRFIKILSTQGARTYY